jgi:hypothetical protein
MGCGRWGGACYNRIHLVLFGMQNRTCGPCLAAVHRILISVVDGRGMPALQEKSYAFLEFRSIEEASNCMSFDGVTYKESCLKVQAALCSAVPCMSLDGAKGSCLCMVPCRRSGLLMVR